MLGRGVPLVLWGALGAALGEVVGVGWVDCGEAAGATDSGPRRSSALESTASVGLAHPAMSTAVQVSKPRDTRRIRPW